MSGGGTGETAENVLQPGGVIQMGSDFSVFSGSQSINHNLIQICECKKIYKTAKSVVFHLITWVRLGLCP